MLKWNLSVYVYTYVLEFLYIGIFEHDRDMF